MTAVSPLDPSTGTEPRPAIPAELGRVGRVVVGLIALIGLLPATQGDFSLLWYVPYAGVGAVMAIRRPGTPIGWLLLAFGWAFALVQLSVRATPEQLATGSVDLPTAIVIVVSAITGSIVFVLFGILAMVFPSGRLPAGRWGRAARTGIVVELTAVALALFMPAVNVSRWGSPEPFLSRNPLSILPGLPIWSVVTPDTVVLPIVFVLVGASVSIFVRYRRAVGVERQQLRWIATALIAVVIGVIGGFIAGIVDPAAGESGVVWLGAAFAFPLVPLAIGFAVLRYRLYEIDTIINRAIVYALLTAILAGGSAAIIGLTRQAFEGFLGSGSDLSIVISTLVVVSTFEPIKKRVQALVDRRFRESVDPATTLADAVQRVRTSIAIPDPERSMRSFLASALDAYGAASGTIEWSGEMTSGRCELHADGARGVTTASTVTASTVTATARVPGLGASMELRGNLRDGAEGVIPPVLTDLLLELGGTASRSAAPPAPTADSPVEVGPIVA